jgi:hypothetical protein
MHTPGLNQMKKLIINPFRAYADLLRTMNSTKPEFTSLVVRIVGKGEDKAPHVLNLMTKGSTSCSTYI